MAAWRMQLAAGCFRSWVEYIAQATAARASLRRSIGHWRKTLLAMGFEGWRCTVCEWIERREVRTRHAIGRWINKLLAHCFMPLLPPPRPINPSACGWKGQMKLAAIHEVGLV